MKILFVCTGNTCRSPMAEGIARKICSEQALDYEIGSAGLFINDIDGVSENAVSVMNEIGVDISRHTPTQLTPDIITDSDIIVPMTDSHADVLKNIGADESKIRRFDEQIPDPYMRSVEVYRECRDKLTECIKKLLEQIDGDKNA